jgi:3-oxoacyl-[acyl-carrier-protein] synthase-3
VQTLGPIDGISLLGSGVAFPPRVLDNQEVLALLPPRAHRRTPETDEERAFVARALAETLGVERRAWAHQVGQPLDPAGLSTLDLAEQAARAALDDAGLPPTALALILAATSTPSRFTAALAVQLAGRLGAVAPAMDARSGCAGGLFALTTAALYAQAGVAPVLVVGTETFSKVIPPGHRLAAMSLGDAAGAVLVGRGPGALEAAALVSDGALGHLVFTDGALPPTVDEIARGGYQLAGEPEALVAAVPDHYAAAIAAALTRAGRRAADVDLFVPHQPGRAVIEGVAARAGIAKERTVLTIAEHANVGAAGWLVALDRARRAGRTDGKRLLLAAVGGGLSAAALLLAPGAVRAYAPRQS